MLYDAIIMSVIVISVVDDMFFASKIRAVAEAAGIEISFPRSQEAVVSKARETKPGLIVVDLHNQKIDPVALARELKTDEGLQSIKLLGFFSHIQTELQRNALAAGFDQVIPRSVFARDLPEILAADYTDKHG
jgi:CheY-like chemotaxis protein